MNGNTLKVVFLVIVGTLCLVLFVLTGAVLVGKMPVDMYEKMVEILGIPTFFGMVAQAFIHSNIKEDSNEKVNVSSPVVGPDVSKG